MAAGSITLLWQNVFFHDKAWYLYYRVHQNADLFPLFVLQHQPLRSEGSAWSNRWNPAKLSWWWLCCENVGVKIFLRWQPLSVIFSHSNLTVVDIECFHISLNNDLVIFAGWQRPTRWGCWAGWGGSNLESRCSWGESASEQQPSFWSAGQEKNQKVCNVRSSSENKMVMVIVAKSNVMQNGDWWESDR